MTQALNKERHTLENAASKLLQFALQGGAEAAEVCATYGQKTKIALEKQDYHMASYDDGYSLGVRVLTRQRQGFASCNTIDPKELKEVAIRAVEIAGFSPLNPHASIGASENTPTDAPAELWDDSLFGLSLQSQKEWTRLMVGEATKDARFRLNEGGVTLGSSLFLILNSQGTHKIERDTVASWSLMGMAVEGDNITSFDYFSELSRKALQTPERIVATTRAFRDSVISNLQTGAAHSYKGLVVFSPRAVLDILLSPLIYHLNGRNVVEKTGKWGLNDLGTQVLNPLITVKDMPWLTDRAGCSIFDREGTPTRNLTALENGKLQAFFLDSYAAKALDLKSSGHASGTPSSIPTVGTHTLSLAGGTEPWADLLKRVTSQQQEFLYVHRYSGQSDSVTGDFSGVAKGAEWWKDGKRLYCAKETLISGNVFEAFGTSLYGLSKEVEVIESSDESPIMVVDGISVTVG